MTIGRNSKKGSARGSFRAPKFLDKSAGFYCRLDEPSARGEEEGEVEVEDGQREKAEDFSEGGMGNDGETLLQRTASRRSSRWRRRSWKKQRQAEGDPAGGQGPSGVRTEAPGCQEEVVVQVVMVEEVEEEEESARGAVQPALVHFTAREEADERVLIRHKKRGRDREGEGEGEEERRAAREQEEGMKMVKRVTAKNYRKALDRAFRRGWEAFIANLYSVTLTPVTAPSPSPKEKQDHGATLDLFQVTNRPL